MKTPIEKSIFLYTLYLACAYQVYQLINGIIVSSDVVLLNTWLLAFLVMVLFIGRKINNIQYLAFALHLIILPVMVYFWISFGGFAGTVPLVLYVYIGWIILTLKGALQAGTLGLYFLVFMVLTQFPGYTGIPVGDSSQVVEIQLAIDFFVIALIITVFLIYIKNKLLSYRKRIGHRNEQLDKLSVTLLQQKDLLEATQNEIKSINDNLEEIIEKRVQKIEEKKAQLEEYAFINAHILRGPLCRIMGLTTLMMENGNRDELTIVHEKAQQVDSIIRRINDITR
jgi:signal transduction histidine kinase